MSYKIKSETDSYDPLKPWRTLDQWQIDYIKEEGNCALLTGRQVGKTTAMSIKMAEVALKANKGEEILCISLTERQAYNIFSKCLSYLIAEYPRMIMSGKHRPTKHLINLKNGVKIRCEPTGLMGEGLRGLTCRRIFADEASRMSSEVFVSVMPMLSVVGGKLDLSSTPCGKQGFFWKVFNPIDEISKDYKHFEVSAFDCPRHDKKFLDSQKASMSEMQFAQEYMAKFLDELRRYFSDELIKKVCILKRGQQREGAKYFLGVDIARLGEDRSSFEIIDASKKVLRHVESIQTIKTLTTETQARILELDQRWNFHYRESIGIDAGAGSLGVGVYDNMMKTNVKRKIVPINNRKLSLDRDDKERQKLLKEDLYDNLRGLMERGEIELLDDADLIDCLRSVQYEYLIKKGSPPRMHIFANPSADIVEGLIRATWLASRRKMLNMRIDYI